MLRTCPSLPLALLAVAACRGPETVTVVAPAALEASLGPLVSGVGDERLSLAIDADPLAAKVRGWHVPVVLDQTCDECFSLVADGRTIEVHAGDLLGASYGVGAALEALGWRFPHPFASHRPLELPGQVVVEAGLQEPEIAERGLHLHSLHPIEGEMLLWQTGDLTLVEQVLDWTVLHRGNLLQWAALDDVVGDPDAYDAWLAHTQAVVAAAHQRGLTVGIGVQLFGASNLQQAFDLVDTPTDLALDRVQMAERLALLTAAGFDRYDLSFGEFFGEDPETFLAYLDAASAEIAAQAPDATQTAVIHVGDPEEQSVVYDGREMPYYQLVDYADPRIVPLVHTVMYYNLYDPTSGAYGLEDFSVQREYLLARNAAGTPVGYRPETAYWVAFDINVPTWLPVYAHSRWIDLDRLHADQAQLVSHTLFSSGWEWGYWLNDLLASRMAFRRGDDPCVHLHAFWSAWGDDGAAMSDATCELAAAQYDALVLGGLGPWLAGRDAAIDAGESLGIVAQPDRYLPEEVAALPAGERAALAADVPPRLDALAAALDKALSRIPDHGDPFFAEARDGAEVTALRARFAAAVLRAAIAVGDGLDPATELARAAELQADAAVVVSRRHAAQHAPADLAARLISPVDDNPTIYKYGYLARADDLCFWTRELAQVRNLAGEAEVVPPCLF